MHFAGRALPGAGRRAFARAFAIMLPLLVAFAATASPAKADSANSRTGAAREKPMQIASLVGCQPQDYVSPTGQVLFVYACLERLPGGIRAHYEFWPWSGTANIQGTLNTCFGGTGGSPVCRKSRDFHVTGVGPAGVKIATDWDSTCPTTVTWFGWIRLLDIRFLPSGELRQGTTGPDDGFSGYDSARLTTNAC
jgi:hypothetical protein